MPQIDRIPPTDNVFYTDEFVRRLNAIKGAPTGARFAPLVGKCVRAAYGVRAMHVLVADEIADAERKNAQALAAAPESTASMRRTFAETAVEKIGDKAQTVAEIFAQAGRALEAEIRRAKVEHLGPTSLRAKTADLAEILTVSRLEVELRTLVTQKGCSALVELYADAVASGDVARQEKIEAAAQPILQELLAEPTQHAGKRAAITRRTNNGDDVANATKLLYSFEEAKVRRLPREIAAAEAVLQQIAQLFGELCGFSPRFQSRSQFASTYLTADRLPGEFDIDTRYPARFASGEFQLPGWAPIIGYDGVGRAVRAEGGAITPRG